MVDTVLANLKGPRRLPKILQHPIRLFRRRMQLLARLREHSQRRLRVHRNDANESIRGGDRNDERVRMRTESCLCCCGILNGTVEPVRFASKPKFPSTDLHTYDHSSYSYRHLKAQIGLKLDTWSETAVLNCPQI